MKSSNNSSLKKRKIIITAGGTIEPIDPVRYIGNYSSGKTGIALANFFSKYSDNVVLIYANTDKKPLARVRSISAITVIRMHEAIKKELTKDAVLIMSAALSDFKIKKKSEKKIKRRNKLMLEFVPTTDILRSLAKIKTKNNFFIGFAVESSNIIKNAREKLTGKKLDVIIANPVNSSNFPFGSEYNHIYIIDKKNCTEYKKIKKTDIGEKILKYLTGS